MDKWTLDFSSAPVLVNWIIPVLGSHFNAFVLHDALVEAKLFDPAARGDQGDEYFGTKVAREEADRIARDAMREQGTGFLRRWIAWVGTMAGTVVSEEGVGGSKRRSFYRSLLVVYVLGLLVAGFYSTGEILGLWQNLPWMAGQEWPMRLLFGGLGAFITPTVLSFVWGSRRLFGLLTGLLLAVLLPALTVTAILTLVYIQAERLLKKLGFTKPNACTLSPSAFDRL